MLLSVFYTLKSICDLTFVSVFFLREIHKHDSLTITAKSCLWCRCFCKQFAFVTITINAIMV